MSTPRSYLNRLVSFCALICVCIGSSGHTSAQQKKPSTAKPPVAPATQTGKPAGRLAGLGEFDDKGRYALVIGNNAYQINPLQNPVADARLISASLRKLNFKVTERTDLTSAQMRAELETFSKQIPVNAIGLFFFAGHGIQVSGRNFLLATDLKNFTHEDELLKTGLDLDTIVAALSKKSGLTLVILDACRDNGKELALSFQAEQGFAKPKQTVAGTYIAFSTASGYQAADGTGQNSPYSRALAQNLLLDPGRLEDIFMKTRIDVINETSGSGSPQTPWETGSLNTILYLTRDKMQTSVFPIQPVAIVKNAPVGNRPAVPTGIAELTSFPITIPKLDELGSRSASRTASASYFIERAAVLEMVEIAGASFEMGSSYDDVEMAFAAALRSNDSADRDVITAEMPRHLVSVPGFYMSKHEVTQRQWRAVMQEMPDIPQGLRGDNMPVVNISWRQAKEFCERLSGLTGHNYRLPTEAEWEFAARAGTDTPFAFGENIVSSHVNFMGTVPFRDGIKSDFRAKPVPAGHLTAANAFGLFEMHGNVWEWCEDLWHSDYNGAPTDGRAWTRPEPGAENWRIIRGGSYASIGANCRSAHRRAKPGHEGFKAEDIGFRVVMD